MDKIFLEKCRLDLAYKRYLQLLSVVLFSGLGAIFTYLGALVLNPEKLFGYTIVMVFVGVFVSLFYRKIDGNLRDISERIGGLIL